MCSLRTSVLCTYKNGTMLPPEPPEFHVWEGLHAAGVPEGGALPHLRRAPQFRKLLCAWCVKPRGQSGNEKLDALFAGRAHGRRGACPPAGASGRCHTRRGCFPFPCRQRRKSFSLFLCNFLKRSTLELCSTVGNRSPESSHFLFFSALKYRQFFPPRLLFSRFYLLPRI